MSSSGLSEGCSLRLFGQLSEDVCGIGCFFFGVRNWQWLTGA